PEFLGVAGALASLTQAEKRILWRVYPNLVSQLKYSAPYFNEENLMILSKKWPHLRRALESVKKFAEDNNIKLGPQNSEQILHRNHVSNAVQHYLAGEYHLFVSSLVKAGKCRHALG
ncbi:MAG TPA: phosphoenolpyruvate carboxylase, partial [Candidatus Nanoarchaeia archaeon]|nr:phosphoenolpyruvate carboxylase [Candidatus Nanoarchaeia archaeon]